MNDAIEIWNAGVDAVRPKRLFAEHVAVGPHALRVDAAEIPLAGVQRIVVVGGGKAAATMAHALDRSVLRDLRACQPSIQVEGWLNCPAETIDRGSSLDGIHLHPARPSGVNEPTQQAVLGTERILQLVGTAAPQDLVLVLLSGGGSALLCAPPPGITLRDKQSVAREMARAGADIIQLNTVRRAISRVKGGGLARACRAGRMVGLILSDVIGDDLSIIASGPTVVDPPPSAAEALAVLGQLHLLDRPQLQSVIKYLRQQVQQPVPPATARVDNFVIGNLVTAVDAAGVAAVDRGYRYVMLVPRKPEGDVHQVARRAANAITQLLQSDTVDCWISGGEPTVSIPPEIRDPEGGRNQHLALAILDELTQRGWPDQFANKWLTVVCGGTDGEDGTTQAAGAWFDATVWRRAQAEGLNPGRFLGAFQSHRFFAACGGLLETGPTGTNVCDLRVATVRSR